MGKKERRAGVDEWRRGPVVEASARETESYWAPPATTPFDAAGATPSVKRNHPGVSESKSHSFAFSKTNARSDMGIGCIKREKVQRLRLCQRTWSFLKNGMRPRIQVDRERNSRKN